jgi:hypothetical protein
MCLYLSNITSELCGVAMFVIVSLQTACGTYCVGMFHLSQYQISHVSTETTKIIPMDLNFSHLPCDARLPTSNTVSIPSIHLAILFTQILLETSALGL